MDKFLTSLLAVWLGFIGGLISAIVVLAAVLSLSSCAASHPALAPPPVVADRATVQHLDSLTLKNWLPSDLSGLPPYLVPAPAGSTPRQRRQWQKAQTQNLAHAGVLPAKVKNSSVATAPGATSINRPTSAVATSSGAATDARKAGQRGGASAVGPGAVATSTDAGVSWWWYVLAAVAGAVGWEVLTSQVAPLRLLLKWRKLT
ncbi:hypothetical protein [Hymenobacter cheonanensis]|uniref:hypothetical protein n=1 Tax=Hymenobacter sp. CA2-7 TaxID=3063993 RepID=UPI0027135F93|nr:hypothetical protein [Hymenobacter sp. CA2-7]MDO7885378.1 hypothetical protein [Hymenobacter sp. CA2-7]